MATSSVDIAVNSSSYVGNAALGGANEIAIQLDTKPFQQLAQYTFLANKSQWDQTQKDADAKIDELAKLAAYNPVNGIRKDTQAVIDAKIKLQEAGANYAREFAKDPKQRTEQFVKFKQDIGEAENILNSANSRAIAYQVRKNAILQGAEPAAQKEIQLKALDKEFDETDIYTKISALPNYKVENVEIPKPIPQKIDTVLIGGNENIQVKSTIFNPATNMPEADRVVLGIKNLYPKKGTPEYDQLSDLQKQQADLQGTVESSGKFWGDMSGNFNAVLQGKGADGKPLYFDENGVFLKDKFEDDNASNSVVMRAYNGLKNLDAYSRKKYDEISVKGGIFDDKGIQYALPGNLNSTDFKQGFIDFNKGISPNQLGLAGMFAEYTGDTFDKKVTETDNAIQIQLKKMDEAGANYRARLAAATKGSGGSDKATETIDKPAILFGQHIDRLKTWFKANPNKNLTIKYNATDEKTRIATKLKPDQKIVYKLDGSYDIVDKNGVIAKGTIENLSQGFIEAVKASDIDPNKDKDGTMAEGFQRKSEAFFNETFGTTSGKAIWDGWDNKSAAPATTVPTTKVVSASTIKSKVGTKGFEGYTEQELIDYYKSQGYEIK